MFSDATTVLGGPLRSLSFNDRPQLNLLNQFFTVLQDGASSPNKDLSTSMSTCRDNPRRKL